MLIVDAQVHLWAGHLPYPPHRPVTDFTADELLAEMDAAGVQAAVIHPPPWDPNANAMAIEAARLHPGRLAVLGWLPLNRPESRERIAGWKRQPGMLGLRFSFSRPPQDTWATDGTMDWLWPAAEAAGIPVGLMASDFLPRVGRIAERHPNLRLIIDHLGRRTGAQDGDAFADLPALLALARHPNVAVKATRVANHSSAAYPWRNLHPHLHRVYDAFGPERVFWGTDITCLSCTWRQAITLFTEELPWLSLRDRELIMGRALCDWLGWRIDAPASC